MAIEIEPPTDPEAIFKMEAQACGSISGALTYLFNRNKRLGDKVTELMPNYNKEKRVCRVINLTSIDASDLRNLTDFSAEGLIGFRYNTLLGLSDLYDDDYRDKLIASFGDIRAKGVFVVRNDNLFKDMKVEFIDDLLFTDVDRKFQVKQMPFFTFRNSIQIFPTVSVKRGIAEKPYQPDEVFLH